ncbi:MAG: LysM peptidoglycan-binding domain-containing protein [Anaerolineales bacterium]|nr:LysM peptidoglycan-binding domain-containing protein [Anaerolineales bacterium]
MKNRFVLVGVGLIVALLAACQRSATTPLPTDTPAVVGGVQGETPGPDATMVAVMTELWSTQAAQQAGALPEAPAAAATATPISVATPVPTPEPVAATATPIAVATLAPPTAAPAACASPYTVKQGDWIYKIARECRLQPQAIIAANPGINPNRLTPGQKLNLPGAPAAVSPGAPTTPTAHACTGTYTVKAGDNLFRIGFRCGFTTEQMAQVNNLRPPYRIFPGQVLKFP